MPVPSVSELTGDVINEDPPRLDWLDVGGLQLRDQRLKFSPWADILWKLEYSPVAKKCSVDLHDLMEDV